MQCLFYKTLGLKRRLGNQDAASTDWMGGAELVVSPAVYEACITYIGNTTGGKDYALGCEEGSPEEVIEFVKKKLSEGKTWEDGIREFVAFAYRGTMLAAFLSRNM